jgi:hypothetical protein
MSFSWSDQPRPGCPACGSRFLRTWRSIGRQPHRRPTVRAESGTSGPRPTCAESTSVMPSVPVGQNRHGPLTVFLVLLSRDDNPDRADVLATPHLGWSSRRPLGLPRALARAALRFASISGSVIGRRVRFGLASSGPRISAPRRPRPRAVL